MPPHLAGREREYGEFDRLLEQDEILENMVLTGLRGVGKTVLLETFKPRADAARLAVGGGGSLGVGEHQRDDAGADASWPISP